MSKALMVLLDGIDDTQRRLIQAQVKAHADSWWHEMPDVWMLLSDESIEVWQTRLKVFVPTLPGFFLVFALPDGSERKWSGAGLRSKWRWIAENYSSPGGRPPRKLAEEKVEPLPPAQAKKTLGTL